MVDTDTITEEGMDKLMHMLDARPAAWVDLDGTLADTRQRWPMIDAYMSEHEGSTRGFDWTAYANACMEDAPLQGMMSLVTWMSVAGLYIVICTSRPDESREATEAWLRMHAVSYDELLMAHDNKQAHSQVEWKRDTIFKWERQNARTHYISVCLEDNWDIAKMYEEEGFNVVVCDPGYGVVGIPPRARLSDD